MGAGHGHHSGPRPSGAGHTVRLAVAVLVPLAVLTAVALIWLWPERDFSTANSAGGQPAIHTGSVVGVRLEPCPEGEVDPSAPSGVKQACGAVTVKVTSGPDDGRRVVTDIPSGPGAITVRPGDAVTLVYLPDDPGGNTYQIQDHQRGLQLWLLAAIFAIGVIAFGRLRGLTALAGLAVTFAVLLLFIVPAILEGQQPLLVAIVGAAAIMLTVLYLTHGLNITTTVAVLGTLASLVLTGLLSWIATAATRLTGVANEETGYLSMYYGNVNMQGLLLAGILIGCLGVLDDVAVTQSMTVAELARANPAYTVRQLYQGATRVGRSHIASVVNTIVLAYAGASLPLLVLLTAGTRPLDQTLTHPVVAQEIVRAVVGTLGLIAAVPITTLLAATAARRLPGAAAQPADDEAESTGHGLDRHQPRQPERGAGSRPREASVVALAREPDDRW
jgi:uncharacterized membrane protein